MPYTFTTRQMNIISAIVGEYCSTGIPVGSQILVEKFGLNISSATVRKEMSLLEQMGYLSSPHTSAGRVPTNDAFQFYVDKISSLYEITMTEKSRLEEFYKRAQLQFDKLLQSTAQLLANSSQYAGVVLSPYASDVIIKRIELVSILDNLILVILVSGTGTVIQKKITLNKAIHQEDLYKVSKFLNRHLAGYELNDIQVKGFEFLSEDKSELGDLLEVAVFVAQSLVYNPPEQKVYLEGETELFNKITAFLPESSEKIISYLKDKVEICSLMNALKSDQVNVQFGLNLGDEFLDGVTFIVKGYTIGGHNSGALGVIGLTRMPYEKLIPTIDYSAQILTDVLNERSQIETGYDNTSIIRQQ